MHNQILGNEWVHISNFHIPCYTYTEHSVIPRALASVNYARSSVSVMNSKNLFDNAAQEIKLYVFALTSLHVFVL